jgi:predicted GNAT family acetyltransferase
VSTELQHLAGQNRYVFVEDGEQVGITDYQVRGNAIYLTHTEVDPQLRGDHIGSQMVQGVLDSIRTDTDYRVVAACPFVEAWLSDHPDYRELESR